MFHVAELKQGDIAGKERIVVSLFPPRMQDSHPIQGEYKDDMDGVVQPLTPNKSGLRKGAGLNRDSLPMLRLLFESRHKPAITQIRSDRKKTLLAGVCPIGCPQEVEDVNASYNCVSV